MNPLLPIRGVVAVIEHDGKLVVIRRAEGIVAGGSWCFPGGAVEPGESFPQAVIREMWEEIGSQVEPLQEVWEWQRPDGGLVLSWWRVRLTDPTAPFRPAPAEVAEIRWATPKEIRLMTPLLASNLAFLNQFWPHPPEG